MSRKFTLIRDYYEEGMYLYKKKTITLNPGVTVLVGCNGIGKTTFLHQVKSNLKKLEIPYIEYDNLHEGGSNAISEAGFYEDFVFMGTALQSSEGENICMNICKLTSELKDFIKTGEVKEKNPFIKAFYAIDGKDEKIKKFLPERWILLDAIDSGLSVDNIVDIKEQLFNTILKYNYGNEIYIIVSANEYEMANGEQCFDVYNGKYIIFRDYKEYRNMILESKNWKNERNNERKD